MFKWIGGLIDRLFAVTGALIFSQFPLFIQQYQQHLSGHVAELQAQVQAMKNAASMTGKSLQQYVIKFLNSGDVDFQHQGELMDSMIQRYHNLTEGYNALHEASLYSKPFIFIRYLDWDIAQSTWNSFVIGFSFNLEGIAYAIIGITLGLLVYWLLRKILKGILRPFLQSEKQKKTAEQLY